MKYLLFCSLLIFIMSKAQSQKDSIKNLSSMVKQLNSEKDEANTQLVNLKADIKKLTDRLSEVDQTLPSSIQPGKIVVLDDKVFVEFRLNKRGFIKVKIFKNKESTIPDQEINSNYEQNPVAILQPLATNTEYFIIATVIDYSGKETRTLASFKNFDQLKIKTKERLQKPEIDFYTPKISSDEITIPVFTHDTKVVYSYSYQRIERKNGNRMGITEGGYNSTLKPNEFGQIENINDISEIKITNLKANTEYDFRFTFYDKDGQMADVYKNYTTSEKPLNLDFTDGVKVDFNALNSMISWKFNKKPSLAYANFQTEDGLTHIQTNAVITKDSCYVKLDFSKFNGLLGLAKRNINNTPKINVVMKDEKGIEKKISFQVGISIPTENEIKAANNLTEKKKHEMLESTEEIRKYLKEPSSSGGKIKWDKLVEIGIPIILSLI